ncbi:hypothetical protein Tco_1277497 [Tanacetum coccineum]
MVLATAPLIGFSKEIIWTIGQISLSMKIGDIEHSTSTRMNFVVVRSPSPYNGIIGMPRVRKIYAVPSIGHEMLKFPSKQAFLKLEVAAFQQRRKENTSRHECNKKPGENKILTKWETSGLPAEAPVGGEQIQMVPATAPLIGFSGEIVWPIGLISLSVKIVDTKHLTSIRYETLWLVRSPSPYNEIIGRLGVRKIQAVLSTTYEMLKFPISRGILTLRSSKLIPLECTMVSGPKVQPFATTRVVEERIKVAIHPEYPE